jgi:hypothetical protein
MGQFAQRCQVSLMGLLKVWRPGAGHYTQLPKRLAKPHQRVKSISVRQLVGASEANVVVNQTSVQISPVGSCFGQCWALFNMEATRMV